MSRKRRRAGDGEGTGHAAPARAERARAHAPTTIARTILASALLVDAALLLLAALPFWPTKLALVLRIAVCLPALVAAYVAYDERRTGWAILLGLIAVVFNPIWPLGLSRGNWVATYLVAAVLLAAAAARFRRAPQGILRPPPRIP